MTDMDYKQRTEEFYALLSSDCKLVCAEGLGRYFTELKAAIEMSPLHFVDLIAAFQQD